MKLVGTIRKEDLGPGVYVLELDDGAVYALAGGDSALRKDGQRVELEGDVDPDVSGIAMTGPTFRVRAWKAGRAR